MAEGTYLVIQEDARSVKLDAGQIALDLQPADDHDVKLFGQRDDSSDTVFLVEDLERMRATPHGSCRRSAR